MIILSLSYLDLQLHFQWFLFMEVKHLKFIHKKAISRLIWGLRQSTTWLKQQTATHSNITKIFSKINWNITTHQKMSSPLEIFLPFLFFQVSSCLPVKEGQPESGFSVFQFNEVMAAAWEDSDVVIESSDVRDVSFDLSTRMCDWLKRPFEIKVAPWRFFRRFFLS